MALLSFLNKSDNNIESRSTSNTSTVLEKLITKNLYISKNSVEKIPVVQESLKKISGTIAGLPIELIKKENNINNFLEDDYRLFLLNTENNTYSTAYQLKYSIVEDILLYGKSYCYIEREGTKITSLYHINYESVSYKDSVDSNGIIIDRVYNYTLNNIVCSKNAYDILEVNSGTKGILNSNKLLELLLQHDDMVTNVLNNITMPSGYLKSEGRLTQTTIDRMKESWNKLYSGTSNAGKTIILEEGLSYKTFDVDLNKLQSLDTKKSFIEDVERLFNLYNISSDSEFLKYTITPIISCIESALTSSLLLIKEKEYNMKFIFDTEIIARADEKTRIESISLALDKGIYSINEARERLDMAPFILDNNDEFLSLSMGKVLLMKDGKVIMPNMNAAMNIDDENQIVEGEESNGEDI